MDNKTHQYSLRSSGAKEPIGQADLLSNLPEVILFMILSRLPTKWVIVLSSVSKLWQNMSLYFLQHADHYDFDMDFINEQTPYQIGNSITRILNMNTSNNVIHTFKLLCHPDTKKLKLTAMNWVRFVTSRGVNKIEITYSSNAQEAVRLMSNTTTMIKIMEQHYQEFHLLDSLTNCVSLVTLKLATCILRLPNDYSGFSSLTTLSLTKVLLDDKMFENLVSKCHILQVLILKQCEGLSRVKIRSPVYLKTVTIYECHNAATFDICGANIVSLVISSRCFFTSDGNKRKYVLNNLKIVTVLNFQGSEQDIRIVLYFLKWSPALELILLVTPQAEIVVEPEKMLDAMSRIYEKFLWGFFKAEIKLIRDSNEHDNLLSILKFHQAFDEFYLELPKPFVEPSVMYEYYG